MHRRRQGTPPSGLPAVKSACAAGTSHRVRLANIVLNMLARQRDPGPLTMIFTPASLTLRTRPSPIVPVTTTSGEPSDGTNPTLRPHGELRLYDMRAAYDEIITTAASGQ
jgi:hypothetical protein